MSNAMYIGVHTLTMDPFDLANNSYAEARHSWLCTGCCVPKPDVQVVDIFLQSPPSDKPLNFVNGCGLSVAYKPFLERLPIDVVQRDLYLGRVFGPDGEQLADWVTFRGKKRLIIRGSKHAGVRVCEQCGRDVYFAMGKKYLYPEPQDDVAIFESGGGGGLVLPKDLFFQLDLGKWPKLRIDELPVLDEPMDGLGELNNA